MVRRILLCGLAVVALLIATDAPAAAAPPEPTPVAHGGWQPWPTPPFDIAPGAVCDFGIHGEAVVDEVRTIVVAKYPDGSAKIMLAKGALFLRVTNVDTGVSRVENASGGGVFTYAPDGSFTLDVVGPILIGFRDGASNLPRGLYAIDGLYRITFRTDGFRELDLIHGRATNVCPVLA